MERLAFCKILWWKNGGAFSSNGLPVVGEEWTRGKCAKAYDCAECIFLHEWLAWLVAQGWAFSWECDACLRLTLKTDSEAGVVRHVQGFFQEGRKHQSDDPILERPVLEGCARCGWESSLLQLVIRKYP